MEREREGRACECRHCRWKGSNGIIWGYFSNTQTPFISLSAPAFQSECPQRSSYSVISLELNRTLPYLCLTIYSSVLHNSSSINLGFGYQYHSRLIESHALYNNIRSCPSSGQVNTEFALLNITRPITSPFPPSFLLLDTNKLSQMCPA